MRENKVAMILHTIGILTMVVGLILGLIFGIEDSQSDSVSASIFVQWLIVGVISGLLFIGFAEVIELLHKINKKLDNSSESIEIHHKSKDINKNDANGIEKNIED